MKNKERLMKQIAKLQLAVEALDNAPIKRLVSDETKAKMKVSANARRAREALAKANTERTIDEQASHY